MKKNRLYTWLMFILMYAIFTDLAAQNSYRTDLLAHMASSMQITDRLNTLKDGMYWRWGMFKGNPVTVIVKNNQIEHIGYALFTPGQRETFSSPVYDFLERYSLEIDLPLKREKTVAKQIAEDGISFGKGTFSSLRILLNDTTCNINIINNDGKHYIVCLSKKDSVFCNVQFPISYDLLRGSAMLENERRIGQEIARSSLTGRKKTVVSRNELLPTWQSNYFILPGESYYTDELNTNRYYEQDENGDFRPVYRAKYPLESIANLLTGCEIDNQYMIDIHLKKYGNKEETISVPLDRWINFCLNNGCKPYFGVISYDGNFAVCEVIMRNVAYGYNHVMKVTFDVSQLETRKGIIQARLNSYIPSSRIKYLFDEIRQ